MIKGSRVVVTSENSLFEAYKGVVLKRDRFYIHVQLDDHPFVEKFVEDELMVIDEVEIH
ncbi:hypothetical protein NSS71_08375 [Niallia sp. FSL W8-0951]|uniref:hypothetical protein n=1 Tax=Niallia sp. FSL W8-0951 TaxID=2954639 RepID=UPI0030F637AE